jgi:hypothetical protein
MRIPLLRADFEHGSYTKIAKALRKMWPLGDQSLMQAQNSLAIVLGYNSLHDAQHEATVLFSIPDGSVSLEKIAKGVAWRMFVRYGIDLLLARQLVAKLHLNELAVAGISLEEKTRRTIGDAAKKGFFYDEMWDHMNYREPWPEETPRLLERGVPPYKWAIYPDRRVFLWSKLVAQIEMLPEDFAEDLRQAGKLGTGADAVESFMVNSLMPAACQPLTDALVSGDLAASIGGQQQWQVKWIVTGQAEVLGCCIVAAKLGGMVPRVFAPDGADAYAALAGLLCGDIVQSSTNREVSGTLVSGPLWLLDRYHLERLKHGRDSDPLTTFRLQDQWTAAVSLYRGEAGCQLAGTIEFSESGQVYLATTSFDVVEQKRTLREEPIFETFPFRKALLDEVGSEVGVPALGNRWHDAVEHMLSTRKSSVEASAGMQAAIDALMMAVLDNINSSALDGFVEQAIGQCLPLRNQGATVDDEDLVDERQRALSLAADLGATVKANMPGLQPYSVVSLGYMVLVVNGEHPGSRHQWTVAAPSLTDWTAQSRLLAAMLIYSVVGARKVSRLALTCAIAPILGVTSTNLDWTIAKIGMWYQSACVVERLLKDARKQLNDVEDWRRIERGAQSARAKGDFLRVGEPIPIDKPKSPAEAMTEMFFNARRAAFTTTFATQDLSSMKQVR